MYDPANTGELKKGDYYYTADSLKLEAVTFFIFIYFIFMLSQETIKLLETYFNYTPPKQKTIIERLDEIISLAEEIKRLLPYEVTDLQGYADMLEDEATQVQFQIEDLLTQKTE